MLYRGVAGPRSWGPFAASSIQAQTLTRLAKHFQPDSLMRVSYRDPYRALRGVQGYRGIFNLDIHTWFRGGGEAENHMEKKWKMKQKLDYV